MAVPGTDTVYDLTILYMSDVTNWCEYLFDIFNPFEVYQQSEEITTFPTHESTIHHIRSSRVQVLIISPKFIETATSQIMEITGRNSVVGLLCGVEKEELVRLQDRIPDYVNWHLVDAKDGPRCITSTTLDIVDEMIKLADKQVPDVTGSDDLYLPMTGGRGDEHDSHYTSMGGGLGSASHHGPQEDPYQDMGGVMRSQEGESNYLEFNDPSVEHAEDTYDCPVDTYDFSPLGSQCFVVPDKVKAGVSEKVVVIFISSNKTLVQNFDGSYKIHIGFDRKSADVVARVLNPHTLRFESPKDLPGGMYKCTLTHNGKSMATFKLGILSPSAILSDILSKVVNPLNYICDVLGISPADSNQLDNELHEQCRKYMPQRGYSDLLPVKEPSIGKQSTTFPTALHFAAKFGLPCVCAMLCEWPGGDQALRIKNIDGQTPDQMTTDEGVKSFLLGHKERSVAQQQAPGDIGYVTMTQKEQQRAKAGGGPNSSPDQLDNPQNRPAYDIPFPVAIPVNPVSKDADIHRLISGDPDDIYNYYDSWERTDSTMVRDGDDDDDDDDDAQDLPPPPPIPRDVRSGPISDYETLDSEASSSVSQRDAPPSIPVGGPDGRPEPPAGSRMPVQVQSDSKSGPREPDAKLQSLIDIQNRVKNNEISMDEAVNLFRDWEQSHNHTESMSTRQSSIQRLFRRRIVRPTTDDERDPGSRGRQWEPPLPPDYNSYENMRRSGISPHAARGRGADISERPERSPSNPVSSRLNATNGTSENSNGPSSDTNRNENGSEAGPVEPPPPRSPRQSASRDPAKRMSWRNQTNFSQDYIDRPIPPIPPRNTSAASSNYSRLPGARPVLPFPSDHRGRTPLPGLAPSGGGGGGNVDTDAIPEHSEHTVPHSPDGLPERMAPPPPRRSSNDNARNALGEATRRQSDPSVASKDGVEPISPSERDASGKPNKRPVPRPRAPPRPR